MLRTPLRANYAKKLLTSLRKQCPSNRTQSSSGSEGKGLAKVGVVVVGSAVAGLIGTVAYAKYDNKFRHQVEETIPYADTLLASVLGKSESGPSPSKPGTHSQAATSSSPAKTEGSLLRKKLEQEAKSEPEKGKASSMTAPPSPPLTAPGPSAAASKIEKSSAQKTDKSAKPSEPEKKATTAVKPDVSKLALSSLASKPEEKHAKKEVPSKPVFGDVGEDLSEAEPSHQKAKIREEIENDMRQQLKRQLAAYNDYLREQLQLQEEELQRYYSLNLEEKLLEEKTRYQTELATSIYRLQEVEKIFEVREKLDTEEGKAREIWLVCQILTDALKSDASTSVLAEPRRLDSEVKGVVDKAQAGQDKNKLVGLALKSIPKAVLDEGVYTEDALITRFNKIEKLCKRVSLIGDEGGSLFRYLLSYLQSALVLNTAIISKEELDDKEVDPTHWDTFAILARVRHHVDLRNLEMSLRYANQLKGEPRKVAKSWIRDVRLHLETRQVANILMAQAASTSVRTLNN